ncbi:uncharacterized protein prx [Paramisgurnus dabryanus]|uniref:uncharacterized protein prx n=1 Tax=Paramisgurnus dabryanus TaxID=90735 RepID=UPI003CCF4875
MSESEQALFITTSRPLTSPALPTVSLWACQWLHPIGLLTASPDRAHNTTANFPVSADSEREDSHEHSEAKDSPVNNKRRSPPSDRPPLGPHLTHHHSISTDEQDSPERIIQKEKLHAELKRVLSEKRSHLRETHSTLTDMDENSKKDSKNEVEKDRHLSEFVDVVVETQPEVGASGYSVVGGGEQGIFIKEVLKDSPAAKHLSLQKGDQLLSAKVYFDNVKYEDALKILQCAEPYKVSFLLKRTVPGGDISIHPVAQNLELRGPKVKMQRMNVKSVKPFKTKRKRGGRFGLKRLKENKNAKAELDIEGSPGRSDLGPVDVEFAFPKIKMRKGVKGTADGSGQLEGLTASTRNKKNIRFPKMKVKDASVGEGNVNIDVSAYEGCAESSGAKLKDKGKGPKLGMNLPKIKKSKLDVQSSNGNFEVKEPKAQIKLPSTESDLSVCQGKVEAKIPNLDISFKGKLQGPETKIPEKLDVSDAKVAVSKIKLPKVRLSCHSDEIDGDASIKMDTTEHKSKMPVLDIKAADLDLDLHPLKMKGSTELKDFTIPDPTVKVTKISTAKVETSVTKLNFGDDVDGYMVKDPKIAFPKLDIEVPKTETSDVNISLPKLDVSLPKVTSKNIDTEGHASTGVKLEMPKLDISFPKTTSPEGKIVVDVSKKDGLKGKAEGKGEVKIPSGKGAEFQMPQISLPEMKFPEGEIVIKGPKVKGGIEIDKALETTVEISLPKEKGTSEVDVNKHLEKTGEFDIPKLDMHVPNIESTKREIHIEAKTRRKFQIPQVDLSLPRIKAKKVEINVEGPDIKSGKICMPSRDISLPGGGAGADVDVKGKGGKFEMPKLDVSLPEIKSPDAEINVEGPDIKGGKFHMPSLDISLPKGGADVDVKGGKFEMPKIDVSLPNIKSPSGEINVEGPDIKGGKFHMPSLDISLPKGGAGAEVDVKGKGGKFEMPKIDVSVPKLKSPDAEINVEGPDIKGGKFHMPSVDISLPKGGAGADVDVKGGKFEMPKIDVSLPKLKSPDAEINVEGPDIKGGKFHMPSLDISLPKGGAGADVDVKGKGGKFEMPRIDVSLPKLKSLDAEINVEGKGGKFEMPKIDVSLPKLKSPSGEINVEGPDIKGGKFHMPSLDISLPKGGAGADVKGKGGQFEMPKIDVSLPKLKSPDAEINVEGPDIKGGKFHMPSLDISLPKGEAGADVDVKGGKFEMPKIDVSLPKLKSPSGEINVEGPDIKGGKFHMPSLDISLPKGGAGADVDVKGKGGKFEMPKIDVSLPKLKSPDAETNVEAPDIKGGKFHMPSLDISLPKGGVGADVDVKGKGGKFEMPKIDVSLPKLKSPGAEINVEGPDIKGGKFHMPSLDISLPKGGAGADIDVKGKGGKFEMPKIDVSLPKLKSPGAEINVEGPDIKGGKFHMPSLDISLPQGGAGADVDVKGGKFEMPKIDVSLPKLKSPSGEINVEGPDIKGGKFHMPSLDISLPKGGAGADVDVKGKGGTFEMPKIDVSLPKLKSPDAEINFEGHDIKGGKFHMPSLDISLPKGGVGADVDVKGKGGKFEMPRIDVSLPKLKYPSGEINVEGPDIKGGKFHIPSLDISLPTGGAGADVDVKGKGGNFEMPKIDVSLPKLKSSSGEINVEGPDIKGGKFHMPSLDISLPKGGAGADVDVKGKGGKFEMPKIDVSLPKLKSPDAEINVEGPDIKGGKFHMPSLDISLPKGGADVDVKGKGGKFEMPKIDVSLPKLKSPDAEINVEGPDIKGGKFHMPSLDISLPKGGAGADVDVKGKGGTFEMPKIDVSLPKLKSPDAEINFEGHDIKGGKFHMPSLDISLPKGGVGADVDVKGKGGKFEMPRIDVSLPKLKYPSGEINVEGPDIKGGKFHIPSLDISLPTGGAGADVDVKGKGGNFEMPKIDVSLPKLKSSSGEINVEGPDIKGGKFHMPSLDISLPKGGAGADVDVKGKGGKFEMPKIDVSLPKLKSPDAEINVEGPDIKGGKFHMPSLDISLPKGGADVDVKGKGGKFEMPKIDVSLPKLKSPDAEINVEGPDIKGGKFHMPSLDISLPKGGAGADVDVKGKGGKFEMPKIDVSLPKLKSPGAKINVEGPDIKGGKFHMPSVDISLPKGGAGADVDVKGKGGKFEMPKIDVSLPKLKSPDAEINVEGPDIKGGKFHMPSLDISLPKGGAGADVDVKGKGGKFEMPKIDVSLPKLKSPGAKINVEGPDIKGGKFHMPSVDISLPKGGAGADVDVKGKGGKFEMPKIDVSLPKLKSPDAEINVEGPDIKGGKFHMPSLDISLPKGGAGADVDVKGKGGKFEMPKIDVSLPKLKSPGAKINVEGPDIKGGKFHMTSVDISLPKGGAGADVDVKGKGGKFEMPKIDVSLPKLKSPDAEINVEGPDIKGGKFHMPSLDISLPKGGAGADVDVKGKGGKFEMPKIDVSLPKLKSPGAKINVEGPDIKGGKFHMPSVDISLPKGGAGADVDVKGKGGKFEMPKIDVSLPKLKSPDAEINVEGPDIKGGKFHMPSLDISLPQGGAGADVDVKGKGGKFEMPKIDVSLPKLKSPDAEINVEGPDIKGGKFHMPSLDISLPKGGADVDVKGKGGKFEMPKIDVSLPKLKSPDAEINVEGPDIKGGKFHMPSLDISLPKGGAGVDVDVKGKGGKFEMPKIDVSLPKLKSPGAEINVEGPDIKGGKFHMPSLDISLPKGGAGADVDVKGKGGKFEMPKIDVSLPKLKSPGAEINVEGPDIKGGKFHMPSLDISLPKGGVGADVDVKGKGGKFEMPKIDVSLPKLKSPGAEINVEGPDIKGGKFHMPSLDISLPKGGAGADVDVKGKGGKFEMPKIDVSLPKLKSPDAEINVEGPDIKGGKFHMPSLDISLPKGGAGADVDVKGKGGKFEMPKIDVSLPKLKSPGAEINVEGPDIKGGKFHMPSLDISLPKGGAGADVDVKGKGGKFEMPKIDVSLPKLKSPDAEINVEGPDIKGGKFHMPSLDISLPKGGAGADVDVKGKGGKFEMPKIDVSLPKLKSPGAEINVEGPDIKGGKFHMPSLDISLPKGGVGADVDVKGKGGKFEMPKIDVSLPKLKSPGAEINVEGPDIKGGKFHMPSLDISLPKGGAGADVDVKGKGGKFEMPKIDVSLPKLKSPDAEINVEGPDIKGGKFHMPSLDISLPKGGAGADVDVKGKGGKFEMPKIDVSLPKLKSPGAEINVEAPDIKGGKFHMPSLDISLPKGGAGADVDVKGKGGKFEMPKIDVSLPKLKSPDAEINVEGPDIKGGKFHMPSLDISLPKGGAGADVDVKGKGGKFEMPKIDVSLPKLKSPDAEINVEGPDIKGGKFHMPSLDISLPKGGAGADVDVKGKGGKFEMPKIDVSLPKLKSSSGEINVEGPDIKGGKFHMPSLDISLPKGGAGADVDVKGKGGKFEMPKIDVSLPKLKSPGAKINVEGPDIKGGKFHMPSVDISLPKGGAGADVDVKGKGGKFEMPKIDVSLPKLKSPDAEINVEGPDIKGGKFHMPSLDISLPQGGAGADVDVKGKGGKFEMPKIDVSLPKLKSPDAEINVEGPDIKGGKFHMPSLDISLPKGGADVDVKGKGGKFEMPKIDVSLPKLKSPDAEINVEGPDIKNGKFHMPSLDISLPKGGAGADVDVDVKGKRGKFEMPKIDVSLPKLKSPGAEINVEGPDIKGGKFHMPSLDISLPKGGAGADVDVKGKGGKFEMPKIDVSLPKLKSPGAEINVEGPDIKGGKFHMPSLDISLPKGGVGADVDVKGKGGKFEMPKIDVSLPKLKFPDAEINVEGPDIKGGKFHMPSLDISLPKGGAGADVDVKGKGGKFEMPKIDVSLPKLKSPGAEINVEGPDIKGGKFHMPSLDISLPKGGVGADVDVKGKGGKFEMPKIDVSLPKLKFPDAEINVEGPDIKGGKFHMPSLDISLPKGGAGADVDVKGKGGKFEMPKIDVSLPKLKSPDAEINVEGPDIKGGKFHMPSLDISLPKGGAGADVDVKGKGGKFEMPKLDVSLPTVDISAPKVDLDFNLPKGKGNDRENIELLKAEGGRPSSGESFDIPDVYVKMPKLLPKFGKKMNSGDSGSANLDIERKLPSVDVDGKMKKTKTKIPEMDMSLDIRNKGKVKMPTVEISLPTTKIPECEVLLPKGEVDVSEADIKSYEGSLKIPKMPTVDISVPKVDLDVSLPKVKLDESMDSTSSDLHIESSRGTVNFPHIKIPKVDISIPHGKTGGTDNLEVEGKGGKMKVPVPKVEMQFSHKKTEDTKTPEIDANFPKSKTTDTEISTPKKMTSPKIPDIDFNIETGQVDPNNEDVKRQAAKVKIQKFGIPLPSLSSPEANLTSSLVKGHSVPVDYQVEYESPTMPKVRKAVFVMVTPETQRVAGSEASTDLKYEGVKLTKFKMKSSFSKSQSNEKGKSLSGGEEEVETQKKTKTSMLKLPKVTLSPGKTGSFEVTPTGSDDRTSQPLNGHKDDNTKLVKLKFPKVEFFSPYTGEKEKTETATKLRKETSGDGKESKSGKMLFSGVKKKTGKDEDELREGGGGLVYSKARTEMLEEHETCEEREETTWFKVPKVTLSPHSTGLLHVTPNESPKGSKTSLSCSGEEAIGGFYVKMPSVEFSTHEMSSEQLVTETKEKNVSVMTKTTTYTETKSSTTKL